MEIPRNIDFGCGERKKDGFFGVDIKETPEVDQVLDLDKSDWGLPNNHFEFGRALDLYEHLDNPLNFFEEAHKIFKEGSILVLRSPHISSQNWRDPTHKRLIGLGSFEPYLHPEGEYSFYTDAEFEVIDRKVNFDTGRKLFFFNILVEKVVNHSEEIMSIWEKSFLSRLFPATSMEVRMRRI